MPTLLSAHCRRYYTHPQPPATEPLEPPPCPMSQRPAATNAPFHGLEHTSRAIEPTFHRPEHTFHGTERSPSPAHRRKHTRTQMEAHPFQPVRPPQEHKKKAS